MSQSTTANGARAGLDRALVVGALVLVLLTALAITLVLRFADAERQRELRAWQVRLGIVADSRFAAIDGWLAAQSDEMSGLAQNTSLQLYLSQIALAADETERDLLAEAQADYLRNLLVVTAVRAGFEAAQPLASVPANVERAGVAGIALLDANGRVLVATPAMPPVTGVLAEFVRSLEPGQRGIMDLHLNAAGAPAMAFAAPVFAVQEDPGTSAQIGYVLGVKEVGSELFPLLEQPGETARTARGLLVRPAGNVIEYLSPLPDGTPPLTLQMARDTAELDTAFAVETPGGFAIRRDYRNREVLVISRRFSQVPWTLVYEIDRNEALAESESRLSWITTVLIVCVFAAVAAMLAFWRHGSSRRAASAARQFREMADRFEHQRNLLQLVTDSQPTAIFILDEDGRYRFANRQASAEAGIPASEMLGKPIANVLGPEAARRHLALARAALDSGAPEQVTSRMEHDGALRVLQSQHIPLAATSETPRGVLVVESDVTEAVMERERRGRIQAQLVRTLVDAVDRRDPFAAAHSTRVAAVARNTANEMGLDAREVETAEIAGNLLNLGKILIDPQILTRSGQLSEAERQEVRHSLQTGADLLRDVEFDGPVVETLRQAQAHWDGTGLPPGLAGEHILVTARIIAVANAFVGMVSPRAHRAALSVDAAEAELLRQAGAQFDRRVVAAFINWLDNRGGRAVIEGWRRPAAAG